MRDTLLPEIASDALRTMDALGGKVEQACGLPSGDAVHGVIEVLRFLELVAHSGDRLTPSHTVDLAWHELILCTRLYAAVCDQHFGRFIHHSPGGDQSAHRVAFQRTLRLYAERFGPPPSRFWADASVASDCGSCDTPSIQEA